ncbi:flippase [Vibrio antiquarius]|uniref:flippase n=1 Tax=Vibrio antiquarius (strain Ex25) TaxID=150340 RepID=UPI00265D4365|nr:flippase [Vibrio antiquarius]MCR9684641.1 flippase [Vibrio antiquarius]
MFKKYLKITSLLGLSKLITLVIGIILARSLGAEQFGEYGYIMSSVMLVAILISAGIPQYLVREIARNVEDTVEINLLLILFQRHILLCFSIIFTLSTLYTLFFGSVEKFTILVCGSLIILFYSLGMKQSGTLNGLGRAVDSQLYLQCLTPFLTLLMVLVMSSFDLLTIEYMLWINLISILVSFVIMSHKLVGYKTNKGKLESFWSSYAIRMKQVAPFSVVAIINVGSVELAPLFIGSLGDKVDVAYFKIASQGIMVISLCLASINTVVGPSLARYGMKNDSNKIQELLNNAVIKSSLMAFPLIILMFIFGEQAIKLLFGVDYSSAYDVLSILCFGQIFNIFCGSPGLALNMLGYEKKVTKIMVLTLIVNIALFLALIPLYGGIGAAISISISVIFWNVSMTYVLYSTTGLRSWIKVGI